MPHRIIANLEQIQWTQFWIASLTALWGGLISYFARLQEGMKHSWTSIAIHLAISGFSGFICWLGCVQFDVPQALTAICTGLAGHMGVEFIKIIESTFKDRISKCEVKK